MSKNNPYRFSLGFDPQDPDHREVAKLLNSLGHKKTRFIVKAILAYCNREKTMETVETDNTHQEKRPYREEEPMKMERVIRFDEEVQVDEEDLSMIQKNKDLLKYLEGEEHA